MISLSRISWDILTSSQKSDRILSLEIVRRMRKGESLTHALREVGLSKNSTKLHLGRVLFKKGWRWRATKTDSIQRAIQIYENGKIRTVVIKNSKDAHFVGEYYNAVKKFLDTGDSSYLKKFDKRRIIDSKGKKHKFETDPHKIYDIEESKEDSEFYEVYADE